MYGLMDHIIRALFKMICLMVMVYFIGLMELNIKGLGSMVSSQELVKKYTQMVKKEGVSGRMVNGRDGCD